MKFSLFFTFFYRKAAERAEEFESELELKVTYRYTEGGTDFFTEKDQKATIEVGDDFIPFGHILRIWAFAGAINMATLRRFELVQLQEKQDNWFIHNT